MLQSQDADDTDKETTVHTQIEEDLEPPPPLPEKSDLEDELLPAEEEEEAEAKTVTEAKPSDKAPEVLKANDRAAASPPCEV